jgi:hypothetical protein
MRRELQNDHPGWQIWYVFHHDGPATWHARPKPWLNAPSPDDLRKLISEASPQSPRLLASRVSELTPSPSCEAPRKSRQDLLSRL